MQTDPAAPAATTAPTDWRKCLPLIVLVGLCAYANSFSKAFVLDDNPWIAENRTIGDLGANVRAFLTRPVIAASVTFNYLASGLNVAGYHAVNLAVHLGAALALFGIVRRTLLFDRWEGEAPAEPNAQGSAGASPSRWQGRFRDSAPWLALVVALLWLVHPLQTQAVTYVTQRCESMMGLFYLLTLYCALRGYASPHRPLTLPSPPSDGGEGRVRGRGWYALAILCCALGMGCKEVMVTAPLLVVLYDWTFLPGPFRTTLRQRWGLYLGLAATWAVLAIPVVFKEPGGAASAGFAYKGISPWHYFLTQPGVILYYLRLSFWPAPLCFNYQGWPVAQSLTEALLPGTVLVLLLLATLWGVVRRSWLGFVGAWFFLILGPTSSILPIADVAFEHRMYLSLAAVVVLVVLGADQALRLAAGRSPASAAPLYRGAAIVAGLAVVVLCVLTFRRNEDYRSEVTIWTDTLGKRPDNVFARASLGISYSKRGDDDKALPYLREAEAREPGDPIVRIYLGEIYLEQGKLEAAKTYLNAALRLAPNPQVVHDDLAEVMLREGDVEKAVEHARKAVDLAPYGGRYHRTLALALDQQKHPDEAAAEYRAALAQDPGWPERENVRVRRAVLADGPRPAAARKWDTVLAESFCRATANERPELLDTLAAAYAAEGRFPEATATAKLARARAEAASQEEWVPALRERVALYEKGKRLQWAGAKPPEKRDNAR
jgi:Tfp pilus assembly protein PilF